MTVLDTHEIDLVGGGNTLTEVLAWLAEQALEALLSNASPQA